MSRDIRNFFKIVSTKKDESLSSKRKGKFDEENEQKVSPAKVHKKKRRISDSDEEAKAPKKTELQKKKKIAVKSPVKAKPVEVTDIHNIFGNGPAKRKERSQATNGYHNKSNDKIKSEDDDDVMLNEGVINLCNEVEQTVMGTKRKSSEKQSQTPEKKLKTPDKSPKKIKSPEKKKLNGLNKKEETTSDKMSTSDEKINHKKDSPPKKQEKSPPKENKTPKKESPKKPTQAAKIDNSSLQSQPTTVFKPPIAKVAPELSFVDKYKPTNAKEIIGQQGPQSAANKLKNWLLSWYKNHGDSSKKHAKPNPWAKDNDGSAFKAALLSGPPGVGKTTTAHLVCDELMFDAVEFNASDTRSKRLLKEEVSQLLSNKSLKGYSFGNESKATKRHVLIMDEVDGMAGNEDRGGVAELISLIKESKIPIICMCNDRSHPKMRSLVNHCYDLRFHKPSINQIRSSMMSICFKEGIKMEPGAIDSIISGTGNDIRQTLNHLALYSASKDKKVDSNSAKRNASMSEKDIKIGPWDVIRKVFSVEEHKTMSFNDKSDLFFYDYNISPLFVQENYLNVKPNCNESEVLSRIAKTADSISLGDLVDRKIRSNMAWSLLPTQAIFSSVLPGEYMEGSFKAAPAFPTWLGKNSKTQKRRRMAQELHDHTRVATSGSRLSIQLDYAQFLIQAIIKPLKEKGLEGVSDALEIIKYYRLLREDIESLLEITSWGENKKSPWDEIDSKVKAALTRAYNKDVQAYSYSAQVAAKKKKIAVDSEGLDEEEEHSDDDQSEDDSLEKSSMIKVKKVQMAKEPKASTSKAKAGTSSKATASKAKPKSKK